MTHPARIFDTSPEAEVLHLELRRRMPVSLDALGARALGGR